MHIISGFYLRCSPAKPRATTCRDDQEAASSCLLSSLGTSSSSCACNAGHLRRGSKLDQDSDRPVRITTRDATGVLPQIRADVKAMREIKHKKFRIYQAERSPNESSEGAVFQVKQSGLQVTERKWFLKSILIWTFDTMGGVETPRPLEVIMLRKDINIAKALYGGRYYNVKVHITFDDDGVLHITGHCKGCSGQISDMLDDDDIIPGNGITMAQVLRFKLIWERWHLNDMRAGDPVQEAAVREWRVDHPRYEYDEVCMYLAEQGLLIHDGYRYGTKWLKEEVPAEVLNFIFNTLPGDGDSFCQMSEADLLHPLATEDFNLEVI